MQGATGSQKLDIDPQRRARRGALLWLALAAVLSGLVAVVLVLMWQGYVRGLQPEYFRDQARSWARAMQARIEDQVRKFDATAGPARLEDWRRELPLNFQQFFAAEFSRSTGLAPDELSLQIRDREGRYQTAVRLGSSQGREPALDSFDAEDERGLSVAVAAMKPQPVLVVDGPLRFRANEPVADWAGDRLRFHAVLQFPPFQDVSERGTTYAAILMVAYLGILYGVMFMVFVQGRRQMVLSFSAQEKAIRLRAISSVAEGIAHEVRNPLNAISLNVQYLEKLAGKGHEPQSRDYQRVYRELGKIRKVIDNFVNFAKLRDLDVSDWKLDEALEQSLAALQPKIDQLGVRIGRDQSGDLSLAGDKPKIVTVITGILDNALEAAREHEDPQVDIQLGGDAQTVTISIRDHGKSPDEEVLKNMFDPYFTTRTTSMGLGLTLAKTVVQSHGGRIAAQAAPGGGLVVTIALPREF